MYKNAGVLPTLPDLFYASDNADGAIRSRAGFPFPPFIIMERGITLAKWLQSPRDSLAILSMFKECAELLEKLHAAGQAHRDLKPDNILLMLQTQAWRLIDFGIAAPIGAPLVTAGASCQWGRLYVLP
jgi:serine/threonine protein kinase